MSEAEIRKLQKTNPNLYADVRNGRLTEASDDFKRVADQYPLTNKS